MSVFFLFFFCVCFECFNSFFFLFDYKRILIRMNNYIILLIRMNNYIKNTNKDEF